MNMIFEPPQSVQTSLRANLRQGIKPDFVNKILLEQNNSNKNILPYILAGGVHTA
jgi:hypothetical protein